MRMRKKKNSDARIARCAEYLIKDAPSVTASDIYAPFPDEMRGGESETEDEPLPRAASYAIWHVRTPKTYTTPSSASTA